MKLKSGIIGLEGSVGRRILRATNYFISRDSVLSPLVLFLLSLFLPSYRHRKILPISWLDETVDGFVSQICPEARGVSFGPNIDGEQCCEQVVLPAINLYCFSNAAVSANSSSVVVNGKVVIERVKATETERCDYSSGQIVMHGLQSALVCTKYSGHLESGFFLGGNGSSNYYHWMVEILVKLKFLEQCKEFDNLPLLVNEAVAETESLMDALVLLVPERRVVLMGRYDTYFVETLVYINSPNECPFNLRKNFEMRVRDFTFREPEIKFFRESLLGKLSIAHVAGRERIFMARRGIRRDYNQDEIFEISAGFGFRKVFMEDMSLREQIDLVSRSEFIVGPTGAAWTNLLFCQPGTRCLCWMAEESKGFSGYSNIAKFVGAEMRYLTYQSAAKSTRDLYTADYCLDKEKFRQALSELFIE